MGGKYSLISALATGGITGYVFFVQQSSSWIITQNVTGSAQFGSSTDVDDDGVALISDLTQSSGSVQVWVGTNGVWSAVSTLPCPISPCPTNFGFGSEIALAPIYVYISASNVQYLYSREGATIAPIMSTNIQNQQTNDVYLPADLFDYVGAVGAPVHGSGAVFVFWGQCSNAGYYGQNCDVQCASNCLNGICSNVLQGQGQCTLVYSINVVGAITGSVIVFVVLVALTIVLLWYFKCRSGAQKQ